MKVLSTGIIMGVVLCGLAVAQDAMSPQTAAPVTQPSSRTPQFAQANPAPAGGTLRIAPGSIIPVQLTKSIDAKKVKTGDAVEAKVTQDLKSGNGEVVVPKDTRVIGHVTEAQARNKEQKESQVGIAFDHAVMKNGGDVALPLSIQAIIAAPSTSPDNRETASQESTGQPPPSPSAAGSAPGSTGAPNGMGSGAPQPPSSPSAGSEVPTSTQTASSARPPITGDTQGVVGISNLKLSPVADTAQPSLLSSDKNNVKLESGTFMLLRVTK
jgi:hypothetical protein